MGLKSAPTGVKAQLRARFPRCFREFATLAEARDAIKLQRAQTVVCTDGNVLMMGVPQSCSTFESYVNMVSSILRTALATSIALVVVFDEPEHMTEAKLEEQTKRDASRRSTSVVCSSDLKSVPDSDDYTKQYIDISTDVHSLVRDRRTRGRFFDAVCVEVMGRLRAQMARWEASGHPTGTVIFDGIDARGADRPVSEPRCPNIVSTHDAAASCFKRDTPTGEGDIKLNEIGARIRQNASEGQAFEGVRLTIVNTIDTDSFAIELLGDARRHITRDDSKVSTLLAMRERGTKRGTDEEKPASYLCCDVTLLNKSIQKHMWGVERSPTPADQHSALTLMVAGWSLCGCDFVEVKGLRADIVFDAIKEIVKLHADTMSAMRSTLDGDRSRVPALCRPIKLLLCACASHMNSMPRVKKASADAVRYVDETPLLRASWLLNYWNLNEFRGDLHEFGFVRPFAA